MEYKNQIFQIIKVTLVFLVSLFWGINSSYATSANAGSDQTINIGESVTLNGQISGFEDCIQNEIYYFWSVTSGPKELNIDPNWLLTGSLIDGSEADTSGIYTIKLEVDSNYCGTSGSDYKHAEDTITLTINGGTTNQTLSVDAGVDQNVNIGDIVNLNGTLNGFPSSGCRFRYNWSDDSGRVTINNSGTLDSANFNISTFSGSTTLKITLKVNVGSEQMTHDSCGKTGIYEDFVYINVIDNNSSGSGSTTGTGGTTNTGTTTHHSSYSSRMKAEADRIFKNPKKIKLKLYEDDKSNKYFYKLAWNYIGGNGQINYELQYSKTKDFKEYKKVKTKERFYNFARTELKDSEIYFFRLKAIYKNKESPYSNVVSIVNKEDPLNIFKITCKTCNTKYFYSDIFDGIDFFIDKNFNINCNGCNNKKIDYLFSDIFIYNKKFELKVNKNNYCRKKMNFNDLLK